MYFYGPRSVSVLLGIFFLISNGVAAQEIDAKSSNGEGAEQQAAPDTRFGHADNGLPGLDRLAIAASSPWAAALSVTAGYGRTESVLDAEDTHSRFGGRLAASVQPVPWFAAALLLDGRYDRHEEAGEADDGLVGDPRVVLRGWQDKGNYGFGAQFTAWVPGNEAPSVVFGAMTLDMVAMGNYRLNDNVNVVANLGYRVDQSAASVSNAELLSGSDRISLGVSEYNAFLSGIGGAWRNDQFEFFGEWSWDILMGDGAPTAMQSPMYLSAGARYWVGEFRDIQLEAKLRGLLSSRPELTDPNTPLVDVPPRFAALATATFRFPSAEQPHPAPPLPEEPIEEPVVEVQPIEQPPEPTTGVLVGVVRGPNGENVANALVEVWIDRKTVGDLMGASTGASTGAGEDDGQSTEVAGVDGAQGGPVQDGAVQDGAGGEGDSSTKPVVPVIMAGVERPEGLSEESVLLTPVGLTTDENGEFRIEGLEAGVTLTVVVKPDDYLPARVTVDLQPGEELDLPITLQPLPPQGQIQGVIQSFSGTPLAAKVLVQPLGLEAQASEEGFFEIDVPPGDYRLEIEMDRYRSQTRPISVEDKGVTIINVDMRRSR